MYLAHETVVKVEEDNMPKGFNMTENILKT